MQSSDSVSLEIIGLIPAAGQAKRISPLPFSKELFPIGFNTALDDHTTRPKVVSEYLLQNLHAANVKTVYFILRSGKWDIPAYFGDGSRLNMNLGYLMMGVPFGTPYTLDQAFPFIQQVRIALGFPDILFRPRNAYARLIERQNRSGADVMLGLFPSDRPQKVDMVDIDARGRVREIIIKPKHTDLRYTWAIAVWTPVFTRFMHDFLADSLNTLSSPSNPGLNLHLSSELYVGDVFRAALSAGFQIETEIFEDGHCIDIGTAEDLKRAVQDYAQGSQTD